MKKAAAKPKKPVTKKVAPKAAVVKKAKPPKKVAVAKPAKGLLSKLKEKILPTKTPDKVKAKEVKKAPEPIKALDKEKNDKKSKKGAPVEAKKKIDAKDLEKIVEPETKAEEAEVVLTDAEGRRYCRVQDCDQIAIVEAYCRYHYLLYWKKIQYRKKILADNKFYKYIEELTAKYPDKFLDVIRRDLSNQKNFLAAIQEMEIDESEPDTNEMDDNMDDMRNIGNEIAESSDEDY